MSFATLRARCSHKAGAIAATALAGSVLALIPGAAHATPTHPDTTHTAQAHRSAAQRRAARVRTERNAIIREARRQKGKPYSYGADGPHAFDCSGLVRYVFLHAVDRSLPHNAAEQFHVAHRIWHRGNLQPGDLVFVDNGGYISHVGIFAGQWHWWVAPHTGTHVTLQHIYHAHLLYARVLNG